MTPWSDTLCVEYEKKREITKGYRVAPGGRNPGRSKPRFDDDADREVAIPPAIFGRKNASKRSDGDTEPLCYKSAPQSLWQTLLQDLHTTDVVDLTPGDGELMEACFK